MIGRFGINFRLLNYIYISSFLYLFAFTASGTTLVSGSILSDTTWSDTKQPYQVTSLLSIAPNASLTINPGVQVIVNYNVKIKVAGALLSLGTNNAPVKFSYVGESKYLKWGGIEFNNSNGSIIRNSIIESAYAGLNLSGVSSVVIEGNIFRNNRTAITDYGGYQPMTVTGNTFDKNINAFSGIRTHDNSSFRDNIFNQNDSVFEYGYYFGEVTIENNNFLDNDFVIRAPEFGYGYGVVTAQDNWWGTTDADIIDTLIYDLYDDATLQEIKYNSVLTSEVPNIGSQIGIVPI